MDRPLAMGCNPTADYWRHSPKTDPAPQSRGRHDTKKAVVKRPSDADLTAPRAQVLMILRPAGRFLTIPFPPRPFAARFFAAVILPPLLFFAIRNPFGCCVLMFIVGQHIARRVDPCPWFYLFECLQVFAAHYLGRSAAAFSAALAASAFWIWSFKPFTSFVCSSLRDCPASCWSTLEASV